MAQFEIPCPMCCKHVDVNPETFEKGGVVKCKRCGHNIKLRSHVRLDKTPETRKK